MNVLEIKKLKVEYTVGDQAFAIINSLDLTIRASETLALVGESGCGKSVTSLAIMGLLNPERAQVTGEIIFNGQDLLTLNHRQLSSLRGNEISMIFQEPMTSLNPVLTIGYQIKEVIKRHTPYRGRALTARAIDCLRQVKISNPERRFHEYPHQLSGGMRQRVMIAMALACSPKLLIADEPTTALDVTLQKEIIQLIKELKEQVQASVMFITHDLNLVSEIADRVVVMYAGHIVEQATVHDLYSRPLHPYTKGLLQAIPRLGASFGSEPLQLKEIPGTVPDVMSRGAGCMFYERCTNKIDICKTVSPTLSARTGDHYVSCHNP